MSKKLLAITLRPSRSPQQSSSKNYLTALLHNSPALSVWNRFKTFPVDVCICLMMLTVADPNHSTVFVFVAIDL